MSLGWGRVGRTCLVPLNYIKGRNKGEGSERRRDIEEEKRSFTLVDHYDDKEVDEKESN